MKAAKDIKYTELEIVFKIDSIRDKSDSLVEFCRSAAAELCGIPGVTAAVIMTPGEECGRLQTKATHTSDKKPLNAALLKKIEAASEAALKSGKTESTLLKTGDFKLLTAKPIIINKKPIGAISVLSENSEQSADSTKLLEAASVIIDSSIVSLTLHDDMKLKLEELSLLYDIDKLRDENKDVNKFLSAVIHRIDRSVRAAHSSVVLFNPKTEKLEIAFERGKATIADKETFCLELAKKALKNKARLKNSASSKNMNYIAFPLQVAAHDLGAVILLGKEGGFTENDEVLLHAAISQTDSAVEGLMNSMTLEMKKKELQILYKIDHIRDNFEFSEMLDEVNKELRATLNTQSSFIILYDFNMKEKEIRLLGHADDDKFHSEIRTIGRETIRCGKLVVKNFRKSHIKSIICIPLLLNDKLIGTFGAATPNDKEFFDHYDEKLLGAIGSQVDTAIFESMEKQKIKNVFKRYVNDHVVEEMLSQNNEDFLKSKKRVLSVLFADIRGFSTISERINDPEKLTRIINLYFYHMTEEIDRNNGTLDKFVGDEVMAIFGAPIHHDDHPAMAVRTALDMMNAMKKVRKTAKKKEGVGDIHIGIGINTGEMVVGNVGCEKMSNYTVLGHHVNAGARLCGVAKADQVLIAEATYEFVKNDFNCRNAGEMKVKGISVPIKVYDVIE